MKSLTDYISVIIGENLLDSENNGLGYSGNGTLKE